MKVKNSMSIQARTSLAWHPNFLRLFHTVKEKN